MIITVIACLACLIAAAATAARHILSARENSTWQTMGPVFRAITFVVCAGTLFLGLRLFFASIDGISVIPPDATPGYAVLAVLFAVDRCAALWRLKRERKAWAVDQLNKHGIGLGAFNGPDASGLDEPPQDPAP